MTILNITTFLNTAPILASRETYIAWRAEWRAHYRAMTKQIRADKQFVANGSREGLDVADRQSALVSLRGLAASMMEFRMEIKAAAKNAREALKQAA